MAWPDISDIKTLVRYTLQEPTASLWSDTELYRHINDAERDIAAKTGCYESVVLTSTTSGSREVPFVGYRVRYAEYVPSSGTAVGLIFITPKMLGNVELAGTVEPKYCFQWGNNLIIEPKPAAAYNIRLYIAGMPEYNMYTATDEPVVPREFHEAIVPFACAMALIKAKRPASASMLLRQYNAAIKLGRQIYVDSRPDKYEDTQIPDYIEENPNVQQANP